MTRGGGVGAALDSLLPTHPQYAGLKRALADTPADDTARRDLIRTNMERWRWMPRNLGARHVLVNVPAFTAALIDDGRVTARHRTVVGARAHADAAAQRDDHRGDDQSLVERAAEHHPRKWRPLRRRLPGHAATGGGISVRQPPGPRNALGRLKIEMPNEHAIYLHDTPSQALFGRPVRAFSHGCIRTQNVRDFAALLLAADRPVGPGRDRPTRSPTGRNQPVSARRAGAGLHRLFHRRRDQRRQYRHL